MAKYGTPGQPVDDYSPLREELQSKHVPYYPSIIVLSVTARLWVYVTHRAPWGQWDQLWYHHAKSLAILEFESQCTHYISRLHDSITKFELNVFIRTCMHVYGDHCMGNKSL